MNYRAPRWPTDRSVRIFASAGEEIVQLRNVGPAGLGIYGVRGITVSEPIRAVIAGKVLCGKVSWVHGASAGIELSERLEQSDIVFLRNLPRGSERGRLKRPKSGHVLKEL